MDKTTLTERERDLERLKLALNCGKYTPQQLGKFFRQYYSKYITSPTNTISTAIKELDGRLSI